MADKIISIKAVLDSSKFDAQMDQIAQKMQQIQQKSQVASSVGSQFGKQTEMGAHAAAFFGDYNRDSIRNLQEAFQLNSRKLQSESQELKTKQRELKDLGKVEGDINKAQQDRVKALKEEIQLLKERGQILVAQNQQIAAQAVSMGANPKKFDMAPPESQPQEGQGSGQPPGGGRMGKFFQSIGGWGGIAAGAATIGKAMEIGSDIYKHRITRDRELLSNIAQQQKVIAEPFRRSMSEEGWKVEYERGDMQKSLNMAEREAKRAADNRLLRASGSVLKDTALKAGEFGLYGAGLGSVIPGVGTAVGAGIGAVVGGAVGLGQSVTNKDTYNALFDEEAFMGQIGKEKFKNYQENLAARKLAQPVKYMAADLWNKRWRQTQQFQRLVGLNDQEAGITMQRDAQGNVIEDGNNFYARNQAGVFERNRIESNAAQLLQSGAQASMVSGTGARTAAQFQAMGLTNATGLMGRLSGVGMNEAKAEATLKNLLANAMTAGIDASKQGKSTVQFTEDMRRVANALTETTYRAGGEGMATSMLAAGIGGNASVRNIEAAQSATEMISGTMTEAGGIRGALGWSYLQSKQGRQAFTEGGTGKEVLTLAEKSYLQNAKGLTENDQTVINIAKKLNKTPKEVLQSVGQMGVYKSILGDTKMLGKLQTLGKMEQGSEEYNQALGELTPEISLKMGGMYGAAGPERERVTAIMAKMAAGQQVSPEEEAMVKAQGEKITQTQADIMEGKGATAAGKMEGAVSRDQMAQMITIAQHIEEIMKSADATKGKTSTQVAGMQALENLMNTGLELDKEGKFTAKLDEVMTNAANKFKEIVNPVTNETFGGGFLSPTGYQTPIQPHGGGRK